jgi:hypothetical protein
MRRILTDTRFDVYVCDQLIREIMDVTGREKIRKHVSMNDIAGLLSIIRAFCQHVDIVSNSTQNIRDPKDIYLLSMAETIGATYIVSGDKDLTDLKNSSETKIIKLSDFKSIMLYN